MRSLELRRRNSQKYVVYSVDAALLLHAALLKYWLKNLQGTKLCFPSGACFKQH
ncbi:hypothetical protein [Scytonema sp. HK-05]|uniref:hypothetical protein n=1 Tax=Scytonema sp. HK-05 TaxID=1137095 RepID=UPI000A5E77FE|nr:hypothetical protein [Scytonema sp. HK-05]